MYIWQWQSCAFSTHSPNALLFSLVGSLTTMRKNKHTTSKSSWPLLSMKTIRTLLLADSWLNKHKQKKKVKRKKNLHNRSAMWSETWRAIMYNLMSTILHHLQHRPSFLEVQKTPRRRKKKMSPPNDAALVPNPGCFGFLWYCSISGIIHSKAPQTSVRLGQGNFPN